MRKLLAELNFLASEKPAKLFTSRGRVVSKIRWWGYGTGGALLTLMALIGLIFGPSHARNLAIQILGIATMSMPIVVLIADTLESIVGLLRWKTESFILLVRDIDFDSQCARSLAKYHKAELKRARLWIKGRVEKDTARLSLFGTEKISFLATTGFISAAWAVYEKAQAMPIFPNYQIAVQLLMGFIGGAILGSAMLRISHQRFQKMQLWIDMALFEKENEEAQNGISVQESSIENRAVLEAGVPPQLDY